MDDTTQHTHYYCKSFLNCIIPVGKLHEIVHISKLPGGPAFPDVSHILPGLPGRYDVIQQVIYFAVYAM